MKYTFDKFKIQLVVKPNPLIQNNFKIESPLKNSHITKKRFIKTAQSSNRRNLYKDEDLAIQNPQGQLNPQKQELENLTRSQSFKPEVKFIYRDWLNFSNLGSQQKEKQYRIFQQKCMDLLSKKKNQIHSPKKSQSKIISNNAKIFFGRSNKNLGEAKKSSVQQMMNNIIQKFKNQGRAKTLDSKEAHKNLKLINSQNEQNQKKLFITVKNQFTQYSNNKNVQVMPSQQKNDIFQVIKSTQLKRDFSNQARIHQSTELKKQNQDLQVYPEQRYSKLWRQEIPQIIKVSKRINQDYQRINPIICTSIQLNSPSKQLRKNLLAFEHIKLNPYKNAIAISCSSGSKRKKVHLNKPSNLKKFMKFTKNASSDQQYNKKMKSFLDFLFKINFSNSIYISLQLSSIEDTINVNQKYKAYVGQGNNSLLIKSLLKRRSWIQVVDNKNDDQIQFFWTQNKISDIHQKQIKCMNYKKSSYFDKRQRQSKHERRKSSLKLLNQFKEHNYKVLSQKKSDNVEGYIFPDGFQIPFQNDYEISVVSNHIPQNYVIGSKKNLFKSLFSYYNNILKKDPFEVIPKTYHIKSFQDSQFKRFVKENSKQPNKLWIVKPGENTNRGNGIKLCPFNKVCGLVKEKIKHQNGHLMTYIIQSYINKPFLYNGRKFDIRHYMLVTSVNGIMKVYWYRDGYIRTSSQMYDLSEPDNEFIHLTNDAIQQKAQTYGMYEQANKLSYTEFQRYLDYSFTGKGYNFQNTIKDMKLIILDVIKSSYLNLDKNRKKDNFQLFGFDFMLDKNFKPYLIQINFNPCLVVNCNVLNRIIPPLIQNTFRLALDPLLPPKCHLPVNKRNSLSQNYLKNLRYQLIFDEAALTEDIYSKAQIQDSQDQEEEYCDNGKQIPQNFTF